MMIRQAARNFSRAVSNSSRCSLLVNENLGSPPSALWDAHFQCRVVTVPLAPYTQSWKAYHPIVAVTLKEENKLLLLNAMGEDKKGKMSSITARVLAHGGSLEDSKMSRMEGEFGVLLKIRIPEANSGSLVAELSEHEGLQVKSKWVRGTGVPMPVTTIELRSVDRPGLVNDINQYFFSCGCVIENLNLINAGIVEEGKEIFDIYIAMKLPDTWNTTSHISFNRDLKTMGVKVSQFYTSVMVGNGVMRLDHADMATDK